MADNRSMVQAPADEARLLREVGNRATLREFRFLERFWASEEREVEFARSCFFGQPESPAFAELFRGEEPYYRRYREANLARIDRVAESVARSLPRGCRILEVGCGFGQLSYRLERKGFLPSGIDINRKAIRLGRLILDGLESRTAIREGDALAIPFPPDSFDAVVSSDVVEHIERQREFLGEIHRVLRPGGMMLLHTDNLVRVRLGVWARRLLCLLQGGDPFRWNHAWAETAGGHVAVTTAARLRRIAAGVGFLLPAIAYEGARCPVLGVLLAPKFMLKGRKKTL